MENDNLTGPQQSLIHTDEDRIYEVFDVELRDINGRAADALEYACELVKVHFQVHPTLPCRVSMFDKISVRKAFIRIGRLWGDVKSKLLNTVDFNGLVSMQLSEPLTCDKVKRQKYDLKSLARRGGDEGDVAKIYGYYNQNELFLSEIVAARAPHFLEIMDSVRICQQGLVSVGEGENERVYADPNRAISDNDIACFCPLLVRPEMAGYELAVSNCSLDQMEHIAKELRKWKPKRVVERKLDPNWQELRNIFFKVGNSKPRFPSSNRTGEARDGNQSTKKYSNLQGGDIEAVTKPTADQIVVLWPGAEHTPHNIRIARSRTAILESGGKVKKAQELLSREGNRIALSTLYGHIKILNAINPEWNSGIISKQLGNLENGVSPRIKGKQWVPTSKQ